MANLNIPFLLLQEGACKFSVDAVSSKIVVQGRPEPNLLVLTNENGCLALCQQEAVLTRGRNTMLDSKFGMSIRPRTLCVPSIFPGSPTENRVIDHCVVRSPAAQILSTSDNLLLAAHEGGTLSLWSTSDGRCIITSPSELFSPTLQPKRLYKLGDKAFPGLVLCFCERSSILLINVYTMTLLKSIQSNHVGLELFNVRASHQTIEITIIDSESKIVVLTNNTSQSLGSWTSNQVDGFIMRGSSHPSQKGRGSTSSTNRHFRQCSPLMLNQCNDSHSPSHQQMLEFLTFTEGAQAQGSKLDSSRERQRGRGAHRSLLKLTRIGEGEFLLVFQDRIEVATTAQSPPETLIQYEHEILVDDGYDFTRKANKQAEEKKVAEKWYVHAQEKNISGKQLLFCVDNELALIVYDLSRRNEEQIGEEKSLPEILRLDLFGDARLFNLVSQHVDERHGRTLLESQEELMAEKLEKLKNGLKAEALRGKATTFNFFEEQSLLYTYVSSKELCQDISTMVTWSLDSLFLNLAAGTTKELRLSVHTNELDIFGSSTASNQAKDSNCILNINQFVAKNYFSRHQHSFFYCDEKVTDQAFYASSDFPSMVLGTNYGRIFIVQLFQDIEGRAYPVIVVDSHNMSPITCLYIAYSSARRGKQTNPSGQADAEQRGRTAGSHTAQSVTLDSGGHLIACSEDGTISVTNMNSPDIVRKLANFSITRNEREKGRIDGFMKERESNRRLKRRQSVTQFFTTERYFNLVRAHPFKVFDSCSFGRISRVVEVQILQQSQLERQKYHQQTQSDATRVQSTSGFDPSASGVAGHGSLADSAVTGVLGMNRLKAEATAGNSADRMREPATTTAHPADSGTNGSSRASSHHYSHHLQSIRDPSMTDSLASSQQSPLLAELMPFRASYACLDTEHDAMYILQIQNGQCEVLKIHGLDSTPIGVYEDALQNVVHVITEKDLNVYSYNKRSKQLIRKSNYAFAQSTLQMNQTILTLTEKQQHFKQASRLAQHFDSTQRQKYDQYSFSQQFQERGRAGASSSTRAGTSSQAGGHHKVLDYLSLSLSLPLYYHPHNLLSQKFTKTVKDLLPHREILRSCLHQHASREQEMAAVKDGLRRLIKSEFVWNDRYKSDFSQEYYQAQGAVTPLLMGAGPDAGNAVESDEAQPFRQQMIVINTKDMISVFKSRMKVLTESLGKIRGSQAQGDADDQLGGMNQSPPRDSSPTQPANAGSNPGQGSQPNISADYFQNSKWPTRLLALVHPFTLDENLDENLELFFGLSIPFVDFRIGVQGADEAFSFVIARDEKEKEDKLSESHRHAHSHDLQLDESIKLLKLAMVEGQLRRKSGDAPRQRAEGADLVNESSAYQLNRMAFVNSEYWKASSYMSSIMSSFFLSTLVSIVEYAQPDITTLMQDWLNVVQYITSSSSHTPHRAPGHSEADLDAQLLPHENLPKPLSVSAISQLMLRKDHSISSCARDVIMKPLLSSGSSIDQIKAEINEWQDLIMDTYLKLKEDSSMRTAYDGGSAGGGSQSAEHRARPTSTLGQQSPDQISSASQGQGPAISGQSSQIESRQGAAAGEGGGGRRAGADDGANNNNSQRNGPEKSINHFFGELEIRGLVNLSYYALYSQDGPAQFRVDTDVQNRLCKCTVILTREIMTKFTANSKEHANLLTILMQLLQTQMRAQVPTFKTKVIKEDVIKILLLIYDFYKKQLRDERFLTRVVAENFHLIHPKNSELYLKLTAAKTLLEIGTYFTEDFLLLIHEQATTLKDGPEYQRNVLDVLRYFINGSRDGLEPYLIQIVQTLLKCLDPNDEQLRKNSTQLISIILSTMVKSFPMIAFHHETQRLAVGTPTGPIAIYDVRTSAKWKILEGHVKAVSCVEFDGKGNMLASYSALDLTLRLWKVGNAGFFSTIMGGTGRSAKEIRLQPLAAAQSSSREQANSRGGSRRLSAVERGGQAQRLQGQRPNLSEVRGRSSALGEASHRCKVRFVNADKAIELVREDGTVEFHRLTK